MPSFDVRYAAKFWVALVGVVASTFIAASDGVPSWLPAVAAICTAVSVYLVPNEPPADTPVDPLHEGDV